MLDEGGIEQKSTVGSYFYGDPEHVNCTYGSWSVARLILIF